MGMEDGKPVDLLDVLAVSQQGPSRQYPIEREQVGTGQPVPQGVPHEPRFGYAVDDPSATLYEGSAGLRWQWVQDKASIVSSLASHKANPAATSDQGIIVQCYEKFARRTPYMFALTVEHIHFMPKENALRALHELGLIAPD